MLSCRGCGAQRETRYLKDGLCSGCSKVKAPTAVAVPTPKFLTATMLNRLPALREDIQPTDSLSVVGNKRRYELMEQELAYYPNEDTQN
jgi:hypothetical protein